MDRSIFEQVTSALTVKAICSPMGVDAAPYDKMSEFEAAVVDAGTDTFSPSQVVNADGSVCGIIWGEDCLVWDEKKKITLTHSSPT
jgi:hypothetical protein